MITKNRSDLFQPKTIIAFLENFMVFACKGFIYTQRKLWLIKQNKKKKKSLKNQKENEQKFSPIL